ERREDASAAVTREGNTLVLTFTTGAAPAGASHVAADGGAARRSRTIAREEAMTGLPKVETSFEAAAGGVEKLTDPDQADAVLPAIAAQQRRRTGRRIDLDLKDADIDNVLRLIADVGRVNIVTADNVSGTVTIRMRDVPWDQALETVLQAKGLGLVR